MRLDKDKINIIFARKNMNKAQFAKVVGISRNRAYVILNSKSITPTTVNRIAKALGVDVTEILEDEGR